MTQSHLKEKKPKKAHKQIKNYEDDLLKKLEEDSFELPLRLFSLLPRDNPFSKSETNQNSFFLSMCCSKKTNIKKDQKKKTNESLQDEKKNKMDISKTKTIEENYQYNMLEIIKETKTNFSNHTIIQKISCKIKILEVINDQSQNFCAIITVGDDFTISLWNNRGDEIKKLFGHIGLLKAYTYGNVIPRLNISFLKAVIF